MVSVGLLYSLDAKAGKLSETHDAVDDDKDDDNDDGITFCLFCFLGNEDDDESSYSATDGTRTETSSAFLRYPYARGASGYAIVQKRHFEMVPDEETGGYATKLTKEKTTPANLSVADGKTAVFSATAAYWYDFDSVHLSDVRISADSADTVGVQFRWTEFFERLDDNTLDTMALFDLMIRVPVVTEHRGLFRIGLAGLVMHYDDDTHLGGYLAAQVRLFPFRPLVAGTDLDIGYISKAAYLRPQVTVGVIIGPAELFVGYEAQLFLGNHNPVPYHGPGGGLRFWF